MPRIPAPIESAPHPSSACVPISKSDQSPSPFVKMISPVPQSREAHHQIETQTLAALPRGRRHWSIVSNSHDRSDGRAHNPLASRQEIRSRDLQSLRSRSYETKRRPPLDTHRRQTPHSTLPRLLLQRRAGSPSPAFH